MHEEQSLTLLDQRALSWRKSTLCSNAGCVEVASGAGFVALRDSKLPVSPVLSYTKEEWAAFIAGVKAGEFDEFAL